MADRLEPKIQYFVGSRTAKWLVQRDGKRYGPCANTEAAIRLGIDAASTSGKNDRPAQVLVQDERGPSNTA